MTGHPLIALDRFPDSNPNPVLRIGLDGLVLYGNPASAPVRRAVGAEVGEQLDTALFDRLRNAADGGGTLEVSWDSRTYLLSPVPILDMGFINVYGTDVTAERAIVKFPDQNPNPVFRIRRDGTLLYHNPASGTLVAGLGLAIGTCVPITIGERLVALAAAGRRDTVEVESLGRVFSLLPVEVPEFGFINVYGTDITAARERARLAKENERLLLNILPEPVADRLRAGERIIADRFDDVTLMFADIVEFTRLSAGMSPAELVAVLDEVFSAFDTLVDAHGLEKVKTIGDAYMIVGGLPEPSTDHAHRMARLALELTRAIASMDEAHRLGIRFRIGIHRGPVVAGVIGRRKFIYDVWGDTVNIASRMESLGVPGRIQVTDAVHGPLTSSFRFESRGLIEVKGRGAMPTWFLNGER